MQGKFNLTWKTKGEKYPLVGLWEKWEGGSNSMVKKYWYFENYKMTTYLGASGTTIPEAFKRKIHHI